MNYDQKNLLKIVTLLKSGKIVFMQTDTIPGLVCSAFNTAAVEAIYELKKRDLSKPPTIIISKKEHLKELEITIEAYTKAAIEKHWPGAESLVLPCPSNRLSYLHRGLSSLAIRLTDASQLAEIIDQTGPLATSSANLEGHEPALSIAQARHYFDNRLAGYFEVAKDVSQNPSKILLVHPDGTESVIR